MKKLSVIFLSLVLATTVLAGCTKKEETPPVTPPVTDSAPNEVVPPVEDSTAPAEAVDEQLNKAVTAIREAIGTTYLPSMAIDKEMLSTEIYGINMENVESVIAEGPMISAQVDTVIGVKAKEGKGPEVEKELKAYRDRLLNDSVQYPMNLPTIEASEVIVQGDYVFFVMLSEFSEAADRTEADMLAGAKAEVKKAADALANVFTK